jgi:hypothetical protein
VVCRGRAAIGEVFDRARRGAGGGTAIWIVDGPFDPTGLIGGRVPAGTVRAAGRGGR